MRLVSSRIPPLKHCSWTRYLQQGRLRTLAVRLFARSNCTLTDQFQAVVFANAGGPPGRGYAGLSQVTVPFVGALSKLGGAAEGMCVVDIDMQILEDAEDNYKVRADLARDDWHYDYRHSRTAGDDRDDSTSRGKL